MWYLSFPVDGGGEKVQEAAVAAGAGPSTVGKRELSCVEGDTALEGVKTEEEGGKERDVRRKGGEGMKDELDGDFCQPKKRFRTPNSATTLQVGGAGGR